MLKVSAKEYCLVRDAASIDLDYSRKLETSSALSGTVSMTLTNPRYNTRNAESQASSAHNEFLKNNIEGAVCFVSCVMCP